MVTMINNEKLDQAIEWFVNYIVRKQRNSKIDFYSGYMEKTEGYKREIYASAQVALEVDSWKEEMIGRHYILDHVIAGMNAKSKKGFNNIIDYHGITHIKDTSEKDIDIAEDILFRMFKASDPQDAFEDACEFYGKRYPELSYLMFLRDWDQFLPVKNSKDNHYDRFRKLGIDTACLDYCSWKNYQSFIDVHKQIRERLEESFEDYNEQITLLDAHSFVWTLWDAPEDLSFDRSLLEKTPGGTEFLNDVVSARDYAAKSAKRSEEIEAELSQLNLEGTDREAVVNVRINQDKFRERLCKRYGKCCLCGVQNKSMLIASHIKPWSVSEPSERLDIDNGFLLCPNHDKLFDGGWISFDSEGQIIISKQLEEVDCIFLNVRPDMSVPIRDGNRKYLAYHRTHIFIDEFTEAE